MSTSELGTALWEEGPFLARLHFTPERHRFRCPPPADLPGAPCALHVDRAAATVPVTGRVRGEATASGVQAGATVLDLEALWTVPHALSRHYEY